MPALKNPRHEKFVLALFEGKNATAAYAEAGFKPSRQNAARLTTKDDIRQRLQELQAGAAKGSAVTVASLIDELSDALALGRSRNQVQACVSAIMAKAKLAGLLVDKVEVGEPGSFDGLDDKAAIVDRWLELSIEQFAPVSQADRDHLTGLLERFLAEVDAFQAEIKARPHTAQRVDPRHLADNWQDYEPRNPLAAHRPARIAHRGNGSKHPADDFGPEVKKVEAEP